MNEDSLANFIGGHVYNKKLCVFCVCPKKLKEAAIKKDRIIIMVQKISKKPSV